MNTSVKATQQVFQLDTNADFDINQRNTYGTVYVIVPTKEKQISVEIYFEASCYGKVSLVSVGDIYDVDGENSDYPYTMSIEDGLIIKNTIENYISDNEYEEEEYQEYDTMESLGFTNSDFLYGN